jgi:hypothetical protein
MRCVRSQWSSHNVVIPERLGKLVHGEHEPVIRAELHRESHW